MIHFQDSFIFIWQYFSLVFIVLHGFVNPYILLFALRGVVHEADDAYSIQSTQFCYWLDQFLTLAKVCFKSFVTQIIKLHNFFNICSRGIIQNVVERF